MNATDIFAAVPSSLTDADTLLTDRDRDIIDGLCIGSPAATRDAYGLSTYGAPEWKRPNVPHVGRSEARPFARERDGMLYCPTCADRGHAAVWTLPVVLHVDGWKDAARDYARAAHGADVLARLDRHLSRVIDAGWWQGYGCAACNADDDDHSDTRVCGRTATDSEVPQCCHSGRGW